MNITIKCGEKTISTNLEAVKDILYEYGYNIFSKEIIYVPIALFSKIDLIVTPP